MSLTIRPRRGIPAKTTLTTPHSQETQNAPFDLQEELWARMAGLPHVTVGRSSVSVPQSRAIYLEPEYATGDPLAFVGNTTEFAHLHGPDDGSLHLSLPERDAREIIELGWGELHPIVRIYGYPPVLVMIYGPRNRDELETVWAIVNRSFLFATVPVSTIPSSSLAG